MCFRLPSALRGPCRVWPLLAALALGACATRGARYGERPWQGREGAYRARQEYMVDFVVERTQRAEAQRQQRQDEARERNQATWESLRARQEAYEEALRRRRKGGQEQFRRLLQRQQQLHQASDRARVERWAQFLEGQGGAPPPSGSDDS